MLGSSSGVVVRGTGAYEKLSGHPARPVLGWVSRVECPVPSHYTCQAAKSGWLSAVLRKGRKIEVPRTWCSMLGGVKDTTQRVKVLPVYGHSSLVRSVTDHTKNSATATLTHWIALHCICLTSTQVLRDILAVLHKWGSPIAAYAL